MSQLFNVLGAELSMRMNFHTKSSSSESRKHKNISLFYFATHLFAFHNSSKIQFCLNIEDLDFDVEKFY